MPREAAVAAVWQETEILRNEGFPIPRASEQKPHCKQGESVLEKGAKWVVGVTRAVARGAQGSGESLSQEQIWRVEAQGSIWLPLHHEHDKWKSRNQNSRVLYVSGTWVFFFFFFVWVFL